MNCDQVFDVLTRGPFPSGAASDLAVQRHLASCGECRQLAEALRPALDLIHESVPPEESWGLPGYWDDVPPGQPASEPVGEPPVTVKPRPPLAVRRVRLPTEAKRRRGMSSERWRLVAIAATAGACAALAVLGADRYFAPRGAVPPDAPAAALLVPVAWPPQHQDRDAVATVALATTAEGLARDLQMCGRCHKPGSHHWSMHPATNTIAAACFDCHEFEAHN